VLPRPQCCHGCSAATAAVLPRPQCSSTFCNSYTKIAYVDAGVLQIRAVNSIASAVEQAVTARIGTVVEVLSRTGPDTEVGLSRECLECQLYNMALDNTLILSMLDSMQMHALQTWMHNGTF
jgi:hypothetical protein